MRRLRYQVATSVDGYIAAPDGSADWIPTDPAIDFTALWAQFDTFLMGRRTFEATGGLASGQRVIVASRTLPSGEHHGITVLGEDLVEKVSNLNEPGKESGRLAAETSSPISRSGSRRHRRACRRPDPPRRRNAVPASPRRARAPQACASTRLRGHRDRHARVRSTAPGAGTRCTLRVPYPDNSHAIVDSRPVVGPPSDPCSTESARDGADVCCLCTITVGQGWLGDLVVGSSGGECEC